MRILTRAVVHLALLLSAAIFGFFYAWVCSTMWGLDATDPRVAIQAMQAMNASVRNAAFAPAFFGTPIALGLTAALFWVQNVRTSAILFGLAALTYLLLGMLLTMQIHVPMNEALALIEVPVDAQTAQRVWEDYSGPWQIWNLTRTVTCAIAFLLAAAGLTGLSRPT